MHMGTRMTRTAVQIALTDIMAILRLHDTAYHEMISEKLATVKTIHIVTVVMRI